MVRELLKSVREYKWCAILTPVFVSFEVVLEVAIPYVMAKLIDFGVSAGNMSMIYKYGLYLIILALLSLVFGVLAGFSSAKASTGFAKNLRHDIFYKVQDYSFENIDRFSTGGIITRITTDVNYIRMAFQMVTRIAVRAPLMMIFSLVMAIKINSKISLIYLGVMPILAVGLILIVSKAKKYFEKVFKEYDKLNNTVEENVSGIRVVKAFVQEKKEKEKFNKVSNRVFKFHTTAEKILAFNSPLMQLSMRSTFIIIAWVGAKLIASNKMTTGELMSLFTYSTQILSSLMMLSMIFVFITIAIPSLERIVELLREKPTIKNIKNPVKEMVSGDIQFENVGFSYISDKNKLALKKINLEIKSGETIGIIGGTGSGKSTLVNLIPRLYDTLEGNVYVGGINVKDYDLNVLRDNVSCVLQKNTLFTGTIKDNLLWGCESASQKEIENACQTACADLFIDTFKKKYNTKIEQGGTNVSGGQKQRLCIARALLKKPKIMILDDSTSAVDTATEAKIRNHLKTKQKEMTTIIISQRILSVMDADRIIVMDKGKINGIGTHEELLKNNKIYQEVYKSQQKEE